MKKFTPEQIKIANEFLDSYLDGNVDIETISPKEIQENIAMPSLFTVAFTTFNGDSKVNNINKKTKVGDFDVDIYLELFCRAKNDLEDLYPDPLALLQVFMPKWFEGNPEEGVFSFNMQDRKTRNLTLEEVIDTFNSIGLEVDQKILYNMHDQFLPIFDVDKKKNKIK